MFGIEEVDQSLLEEKSFNKAADFKRKKTDFALQFALSDDPWTTPYYIKEGLTWLAKDNTNDTESLEEAKDE